MFVMIRLFLCTLLLAGLSACAIPTSYTPYKLKVLPVTDGNLKKQNYQDGVYEGNIVNGAPHGQGIFTFRDGRVYQGSFQAGRMEGQGELKSTNGDLYIGLLSKDKKEGRGELKFADGRRYTGGFKNDQFEGEGELVQPNGVRLNGNYVQGKLNGPAEWLPGDRTIRVKYISGKVDLNGSINWKNGDSYQGGLSAANLDPDGYGIWKRGVNTLVGTFSKGILREGYEVTPNTFTKGSSPNVSGEGICYVDAKPEKCELFQGERIDALHSQRKMLAKQQQLAEEQKMEIQALSDSVKKMQQNQSAAAPSTITATGLPAAAESPSNYPDCLGLIAAKKACERIPGDPFGVAIRLCKSTAESKFDGCPAHVRSLIKY